MNYIFCHLGGCPIWLLDSIESVRLVEPDSSITLVTDQVIRIGGVEVLNIHDIATRQTKLAMGANLFADDGNGQLWRTALFRVFMVRDAMKVKTLDKATHFDSDVILYKSSKDYLPVVGDVRQLSIPACNANELVFGFSVFGSMETTDEICEILYSLMIDENKRRGYFADMPNEMQLLSGIQKNHPHMINLLENKPNRDKLIFDPSSYGQFFGGRMQKKPPDGTAYITK